MEGPWKDHDNRYKRQFIVVDGTLRLHNGEKNKYVERHAGATVREEAAACNF